MSFGWIDLLRAEAVALLACGAAFTTRAAFRRRRPAPAASESPVFLFDGDRLVDASVGARALLHALDAAPDRARDALLAHLARHIPDIAAQFDRLPQQGHLHLRAPDLTVDASLRGGLLRVCLDGDPGLRDALVHAAQTDEIARLRHVVHTAVTPLWQEDDGGQVVWANPAYMTAAGNDTAWPLPNLFPTEGEVKLSTGWMAATRDGGVGAAWPLDRAIDAEQKLRDFRQTLTRTFADLPIGLAIFDRTRLLQVFNPALIELTGLAPEMLSGRPSLFTVLDALRERAMIPEPKDYRTWRKRMIELEEAATHGRFEETWNLPGGQTWRVVGRPHPDGAMALMFEDISGEMTRTRSYRAELELGQSVLDAMEEAVAVFSPSGGLVMSNAAYARLWDDDPGIRPTEEGIATLCDRWRTGTHPDPLWAEVERFALTIGPRTGGSGTVRLLSGQDVECRFTALAGGATLVAFLPLRPARPIARYA